MTLTCVCSWPCINNHRFISGASPLTEFLCPQRLFSRREPFEPLEVVRHCCLAFEKLSSTFTNILLSLWPAEAAFQMGPPSFDNISGEQDISESDSEIESSDEEDDSDEEESSEEESSEEEDSDEGSDSESMSFSSMSI